jgi:hypothetical protein
VLARLIAADDPIALLDEILVEHLMASHGGEIAARGRNFFRNVTEQYLGTRVSDQLTSIHQRCLKIACFSEDASLLTLWAYYTSNHEGFCIEYPITAVPPTEPQIRMLHPVIYDSDRVMLDTLIQQILISGRPVPFVTTLPAMHKAVDWAHEREWRLVVPDGRDLDGIPIAMPRPSRILLGTKMKSEDMAELLTIVRALGIPAFKMKLALRQFQLVPDVQVVP